MRTVIVVLAFLVNGCDGEQAIGESCLKSGGQSNCVEDAVCTAESGDTKICRLECVEQADCPDGTTCNGVSGSNAKSCQPN